MAEKQYSERFVRLYWKEPKTGFRDGDSYAADLWLIDLGKKHFSSTDYYSVWDEAAEYTRMRLKVIEKLEEQYYWLLNNTELSTNTLEQEYARKSLINEVANKITDLKEEMTHEQ